MINIGPGAYIHCYEYSSPTIAAVKAVMYAPYKPENDAKMNKSNIINVLRGTINGEETNGSK